MLMVMGKILVGMCEIPVAMSKMPMGVDKMPVRLDTPRRDALGIQVKSNLPFGQVECIIWSI